MEFRPASIARIETAAVKDMAYGGCDAPAFFRWRRRTSRRFVDYRKHADRRNRLLATIDGVAPEAGLRQDRPISFTSNLTVRLRAW
jgi:hypothetical protein